MKSILSKKNAFIGLIAALLGLQYTKIEYPNNFIEINQFKIHFCTAKAIFFTVRNEIFK